MSDQKFQEQGRIGVVVDEQEHSVAPAGNTTIPLTIINRGLEADTFSLAIGGIPSSWVSTATPQVTLEPGESVEVTLILQAPPLPESNAGQYPVRIRATSQKVSGQYTEIEIQLTVAVLEVQGRIGLLMDSVQFTVAPGSSSTFSIVLINHGLARDTFRMKIEGIPMGWVSTSSPVTTLDAGEQREIPITIRPPRAPESRAGRHAFNIEIVSQSAPDQVAEADCTLTLAAYTKLETEMQPQRMDALQNAQISLTNEGNVRENVTVSWQSHDDQLAFEVGSVDGDQWIFEEKKMHDVRVAEGKTVNTIFRAGLRQRPLIGGKAAYPFTAHVKSSGGESQSHNGEVMDQALIPIWVLPVVLIMCIMVVCMAIFFFNWQNNQRNDAASATQTIVAAATTISAQETLNAQLTAGVPTNTPIPTFTPTPTDLPTDTPVPTETPTITPTETPSETPTEEPTELPTATDEPEPTEEPTEAPPTEEPTEEPPTEPTEEPPPALRGVIIVESNRSGVPMLYALNSWNFEMSPIAESEGSSQAAWSPDGGRIAVVRENDIYTTNPDGTNAINITNSPDIIEREPTWSPNGANIAYSSNQDGDWEIYVIPSGGGESITKLTDNEGIDDTQPSWFRTSGLLGGTEWIAFTTNRDGNQEVYVMANDGANPRNLSNNPANDNQPAAAPVGQAILFTSDRDGNQEIYSVYEDGSGLVNLSQNPANDSLAAWAKDSDWAVFTTDRDGNSEVYVMTAEGQNPYNVTRHEADDVSWSWR